MGKEDGEDFTRSLINIEWKQESIIEVNIFFDINLNDRKTRIFMLQDINDALSFCIAIVGFFIVFFLLKNRDFKSNLWLAAFNFVLVVHFVNLFLLSKFNIPHFGLVYGLLYGPLIMNFILAYDNSDRKRPVIYFIPAFLLFAWIIFVDINRDHTPDFELTIIRLAVTLHLLGYIIATKGFSKKLREIAVQTRSKIDDDKILLIQRAIRVISIAYFISLVEIFMSSEQNDLPYKLFLIIVSVFILFGMFSLIYQGLENRFIFSEITENEKQVAGEAKRKYISSILKDEESEKYIRILMEVIDQNKPYKNYNLSLDELAQLTNIPQRFLSQVINEQLGRNFFDFINFHRIEDAKLLLKDPEKRISDVMYDVGFLSRSSFNTSFKKYVGKTPSQYRKSL